MQPTIRPFVTAGVAMAAAGAVAFTPLAVPPDVQVAAPAPVSASVELTASWEEVFNTAAANATKIAEFYGNVPAPALQQAVVNQVGYLKDVFNDPASVGAVLSTVGENLETVLRVATLSGDLSSPPPPESAPLFAALGKTVDSQHLLVLLSMNGWSIGMPAPEVPKEIVSLLNFAASPLSAVLIGAVGPALSPAVAALNSIQEGDLLNLPANVVDGFLNGATLNLDFVLPLIADSMPEGMSFSSLSLELGGLLSPGTVGSYGKQHPGGSLFNSLSLSVDLGSGRPTTITGNRVGPIAAMVSLSRIVASTLGWDGTGNPLDELNEPEPAPAAGATTVLAANAEDGPAALPSASRKLAALNVSADAAPEVKSLSPSEAPAVDSPDPADEAKAVEVSAPADDENSAEGATGHLVRESAKAEPGKAGTARVKPAAKLRESADSVGGKVNSTVKKVRDGLKSGFSKPAKKQNVAGSKKSAGSDGAGAAGSGANSDA